MLRGQEGIHSVKVALLAERAVVEYDPSKWTDDKIMSVSVPISQAIESDSLSISRSLRAQYAQWLHSMPHSTVFYALLSYIFCRASVTNSSYAY